MKSSRMKKLLLKLSAIYNDILIYHKHKKFGVLVSLMNYNHLALGNNDHNFLDSSNQD